MKRFVKQVTYEDDGDSLETFELQDYDVKEVDEDDEGISGFTLTLLLLAAVTAVAIYKKKQR